MDDSTDEEVYRKHAAELFRYATFLAGPSGATDLVADAVLAAFQSPGWALVRNRRAYLFRAVLNAARQQHRETQRRQAREVLAARARHLDNPPAVRIEVLEAVRSLSVRQRSIVFFAYWYDLSPTEIARHLGVSTRTVQREIHRAHRLMEANLR